MFNYPASLATQSEAVQAFAVLGKVEAVMCSLVFGRMSKVSHAAYALGFHTTAVAAVSITQINFVL